MLLPSQSTGFQHRRIHSPAPLDMWVPSLKQPTSTSTTSDHSQNPAAKPAAAQKPRLPLTPPLTPASTRRTDSDASDSLGTLSLNVNTSLNVAIPNFNSYRAFQQVPKWSLPAAALSDTGLNIPNESDALPSPTSPIRTRSDGAPTRFLFVSGVSPTAPTHTLKDAFTGCGDLKGIFVRFQREWGSIILAFHDIRHTLRAHRAINGGRVVFIDGQGALEARFVSAEELRGLIGLSPFISTTDGSLLITSSPLGGPVPPSSTPSEQAQTQDQSLDAPALQNVLASFGELRVFGYAASGTGYHAEFFDARDAQSALTALNGRVILRERLHISPAASASSGAGSFPPVDFPVAPTDDVERERDGGAGGGANTIPFPTSAPVESPARVSRRLSVDSSIPFPSHTPAAPPAPSKPTPTPSTPAPHHHARRTSNIYHGDATLLAARYTAHISTPPRPRSISVDLGEEGGLGEVEGSAFEYMGAGTGAEEYGYEQGHEAAFAALESIGVGRHPHSHPSPRHSHTHIPHTPHHSHVDAPRHHPDAPPERNRIDVARIERGDDTRTTVMIKNIPNKMSDKNLVEFIGEVCPRKIDFLYLRMDFTNGCNVGYAFVNFIHVEDLLTFARAKLGTKWNLFSSEKVLGMSYANYQGKEALIDKFRSSSIMDQRESWRPKLFHSSGPKRGLPEDFPAPTHVRRKERGVAGVGAGAGGLHVGGRWGRGV